eukprot:NODE_15_length_50561_cov_0.608081.p5 type:complete len:831 gc:universal NODE_15_length_50561_cov_0.608081:4373-1881(-)
MFSVFIVLHKAKHIIPSKSPIYFECTLNNEKLTSEVLVSTSEMTIDTELVFYLNEQQFNFLKQNRLNCKLSCYQKPKKLVGFVLLDMRRAENKLPPESKKWFTLMNTNYTPRPQVLIGFGVGLVPEQPDQFLEMDELSPERLITQALMIWSPNIYLNLHQGNIVVGEGKEVYRMTATISCHFEDDKESVALKLLNKHIILNKNKPISIHQIVFEGHLSELQEFWKSTEFKVFVVKHENVKPIKVLERGFHLIDFLSGTLKIISLNNYDIKLECIGYPRDEISQNRKPKSISPTKNDISDVSVSKIPVPVSKSTSITSLSNEAHQYRLSIDLRSIIGHSNIKLPVEFHYELYVLGTKNQFSTRPPVMLQNNIESFIQNGFCAYEMVMNFTDLKALLKPLNIEVFSHDQYKKKSLVGNCQINLGNVLKSERTPEIHGQGDLQLIDIPILIENVGQLKATIALEDFGEFQEKEIPEIHKEDLREPIDNLSYLKEFGIDVENQPESPKLKAIDATTFTPHQTDEEIYRKLSLKFKSPVANIAVQTDESKQDVQHLLMDQPALKRNLEKLFSSYKEVEQQLTELRALDDELRLKTENIEKREASMSKEKQALLAKFELEKQQVVLKMEEIKNEKSLQLKQSEQELLIYKEKVKELMKSQKDAQSQYNMIQSKYNELNEKLIHIKHINAESTTTQLQDANHKLQSELNDIKFKLQKSEQVKKHFKERCIKLQFEFDNFKLANMQDKQSKLDTDSKMVEKLKWRYLIQEEQKKNNSDLKMLESLRKELNGITKKSSGDPEIDRLRHERQELLSTGLYHSTDPLILQLDSRIKELCEQ